MIKVFGKDNIEYDISELRRLGNNDYALVMFKSDEREDLNRYCACFCISIPSAEELTYDKETDTYSGIYTSDVWYSIEETEELIKTLIRLKVMALWKKNHD